MCNSDAPTGALRYAEEEVRHFPCVLNEHYIPFKHALILALQIAPREAVDRFSTAYPQREFSRHIRAGNGWFSSHLGMTAPRERTLQMLQAIVGAWEPQAQVGATEERASLWFTTWRQDPGTEEQRRAHDLKSMDIRDLMMMDAQLDRLEKRRDESAGSEYVERVLPMIDRLTFLRAQQQTLLSPRQELWIEEGVLLDERCQTCRGPLSRTDRFCAICEAGPLCDRCIRPTGDGTAITCGDAQRLHNCASD